MTGGAYAGADLVAVRATLAYLRAARVATDAHRARGRRSGVQDSDYHPMLHDPAWLVTMAINRKAGWLDDPTLSRGSAMPVAGRYPKRAEGDCFMAAWRLARTINGTRIIVRSSQCPPEYRERLRHRLTWPGEGGPAASAARTATTTGRRRRAPRPRRSEPCTPAAVKATPSGITSATSRTPALSATRTHRSGRPSSPASAIGA